MKDDCINICRRSAIDILVASVALVSLLFAHIGFAADKDPKMQLIVDHVMFPSYLSDNFLNLVEEDWRMRKVGRVFSQPPNSSFKGIYFQSKSFYVEYLSNTKSQPYWSNAVYVVVPKRFWSHYKNPAFVSEHFLIPSFGCGYQLVSPDFPYRNAQTASTENVAYDGFVLLISRTLEKELLSIGGAQWSLPENGKVRVHDMLLHTHDMAVIDEGSKLVAPILQPNPILREHL